jgi:TM2 domain-containing membrane protein YozV
VKLHEMYVDFGMKKKIVLEFLFCTCIVTICVELV